MTVRTSRDDASSEHRQHDDLAQDEHQDPDEANEDNDQRLSRFKITHKVIHVIKGFGGLEYYNGLANGIFKKIPLVSIRLNPKVYILKKIINN